MEEIDLKEIVKYFWKKKIIIIISIIIAGILGFLYTKFCIIPEYEVSTTLILTETNFETEADVASYSKLIDRYCVVANSKNVANKVIGNLKLDITNDEYKEMLLVKGHIAEHAIIIKITSDDSSEAVKIANETAKVFMNEVKNIYQDEKIQVLDAAVENNNPINIDYASNIAKMIVVAIIVACVYIIIRYVWVNYLKNKK